MSEIIDALNQLEKEKNISKEVIMDAIEKSLVSACEKDFGKDAIIEVSMDRTTGDLSVSQQKVVVEEVERSTSMLLVLKPLPFVTLAITKGVGSCALTFAFYVVTLIDIPIFHHGTSLAMGLSSFQFARIDPTILEGVGTDIDALGSSWLPGHHVEQAAKE